jgi:hypothetical protein
MQITQKQTPEHSYTPVDAHNKILSCRKPEPSYKFRR